MNQSVFLTRMMICTGVLALFAMVATTSPAQADETGTLRITFKLKGDAPNYDNIKPTVDQAFCGLKDIPDESLVINPENKGIKNVFVWVKAGRRTKLPDFKSEPKTRVLANEACRFEPHAFIAHPGDTIKVTNPDKVSHNANFMGINLMVNNTVPAGGEVDVKIEEEELSVITVACNIHPWMTSRLLIVGHPYAAISDDNGVIEIKGLPVGEELEFQALHDVASFKDDIFVDGKKTSWSRNRFKLEIEAGVNDLGVVEIPAAQFAK